MRTYGAEIKSNVPGKIPRRFAASSPYIHPTGVSGESRTWIISPVEMRNSFGSDEIQLNKAGSMSAHTEREGRRILRVNSLHNNRRL